MKNILGLSLATALSLQAAETINEMFKEGRVNGNIKYYYIDTIKEGNAPSSSQHANSLGGQLGYTSGSFHGLKLRTTFMTTNPVASPKSNGSIEPSILAQDNAKRPGATVADGTQGFDVLGEAYAQYNRDNYELWFGRRVIETPLIDAKEVRLLPSAIQGAMASVKLTERLELSTGYIDRFKQRSSDQFINIIEHALGTNTHAITGNHEGFIIPMSINYKNSSTAVRVYDYYAEDFMNSLYADAAYSAKIDSDLSYSIAGQIIAQDSIGNANNTAAKTIMGGEINAQAIGAKASVTYQESTFLAAYSHVSTHSGDHDSLVLPWDGTPLFTNMLTANNLTMSLYGSGLQSDSAYIGGTTGIKFAFNQKYDFTGFKGITSGFSYARYNSGRFPEAQEDINVELGYGVENFSLALKGIRVKNNTSAGNNNTLNLQNDHLKQYRVIGNYKF